MSLVWLSDGQVLPGVKNGLTRRFVCIRIAEGSFGCLCMVIFGGMGSCHLL